MDAKRHATLYRMVLPDHECPYGLRAKALLERAAYAIDEHILATREQTDAFKAERGLSSTPLVEIDGEVIGGHAELTAWLAAHSGR